MKAKRRRMVIIVMNYNGMTRCACSTLAIYNLLYNDYDLLRLLDEFTNLLYYMVYDGISYIIYHILAIYSRCGTIY